MTVHRDYNHCGKKLYKANYLLKNLKNMSTRFFICENIQEVEKELLSYDIVDFSIRLIDSDISICILNKEVKQ